MRRKECDFLVSNSDFDFSKFLCSVKKVAYWCSLVLPVVDIVIGSFRGVVKEVKDILNKK
jgi:hypothetical protein